MTLRRTLLSGAAVAAAAAGPGAAGALAAEPPAWVANADGITAIALGAPPTVIAAPAVLFAVLTGVTVPAPALTT